MHWKTFIVFSILWSCELKARETGLIEKITTLRFGDEYNVNATKGEVDLSAYSDGYFHIQGEILFIPGEFLKPKYMSLEEFLLFKEQKELIITELKLRPYPYPIPETNQTFGTFILRIHNKESNKFLIAPQRYYHPLKIYAAKPQITESLLELGELAKDPQKIGDWIKERPIVNTFAVDGDFLLYIHASSPLIDGKNSLNVSSFLIGPAKDLSFTLDLSRDLTRVIIGAFLLLAIFYGFIFSFRMQDRSSLYLSTYSLVLSIACITYTGFIPIEPHLIGRFVTIFNVFSLCLLCYYILHKIEVHISRLVHRVLTIMVSAIFVINPLAQILQINPFITTTFFGILFLSDTLILTMIYFGFRKQLAGMRYFGVGALINGFFQTYVMLVVLGSIRAEFGFSLILSHLVMAIALGIVNAKEFALTNARSDKLNKELLYKNQMVQELNRNLEIIVKDRTAEIHSLLLHIPQGILSIGEHGLVKPHYSAILPELLGQEAIAGKTFFEIFLSNCDISKEEKEKIWQVILHSLDKKRDVFDSICSRLPTSCIYSRGPNTLAFKVTWNVEVNANNRVNQILVTISDSTKEVEAQMGYLNSEIRMHSLNEQMKPHFLFNCLNVIDNLIIEAPEEASSAVSKLAELYRYILVGAKRNLWPLENEILVVRDALDLQKIRFRERIDYEFNLDANLQADRIYLPCLMLHTVVDNSIKHAISKNPNGGKIFIEVRTLAYGYELTVKDTGQGPNALFDINTQRFGTNTGLENSQKRLVKYMARTQNLKLT